MFELLIKQCRLQRKALYLSLALVAGMFAFGTILHEIILCADADPETTVFHLGSLMAVVGLMATAFFYESQEMYMSANFALGMGAVRKQFYPMTLLAAVIRYSIVALVIWLLDCLEGFKLSVLYPGHEVEQMFGDHGLSFGSIYAMMIFVVSLGILFGVLMLRFGRNVFWVIWALWMAVFILGPRAIENLAHTHPEVLEKLAGIVQNHTTLVTLLTALVVSLIMMAGGWLSFRKQQVNS